MIGLFLTQCPKCKSSFKASAGQLHVAQGRVRCGACLMIFSALESRLADTDANEIAANETDSPTYAITEQDLQKELDWINGLSSRNKQQYRQASTRSESNHVEAAPAIQSAQQHLDLSLDLDLDAPPVGSEEQQQPRQTEPQDTTADTIYTAIVHDPDAPEKISPDELAQLNAESESVQFHWQESSFNWWQASAWTLLNLVLIASLSLQYFWTHFDTLATQAKFRPWYQTVCQNTACELPALLDTQRIKSQSLSIRSHPEHAQTLLVNIVFSNQAPFAQPFPLLELQFTDANNAIIASREFMPQEYLDKDLQNISLMPSKSPIHISMGIIDPGPKAINYQLHFKSN